MHSPKLIARNVMWNFFSMILPLGVAVITMPLLIHGLGTERFGILALVWIILGYVSLIDLGVGRAMTKLVAEKIGGGRDEEIPALVWTGMLIMIMFGIFSGGVLMALAPWLVNQVLNIPVSLQPETLKSVYLLALTIPVITSTAGLRGILEAKQQFGAISVLKMILGISMYASPLLILGSTNNLYLIVAVLVLVRVMLWIAHLWLCFIRLPDLKHKFSLSLGMVRSLLGQGGWMTVSNVISPMMVYFDRFFIASAISATAVAYYTTPYDMVTKLIVFSGAISGVLFPLFSSSFKQNSQHCFELYKRGVKYVALLMFPIILILVLMANEILTWWINPEFAEHGAGVLRMIAIGVFMNSLAQIPFALIQGSGRADLTAKFHAAELPFYLIALWWLSKSYGIEGVAIAWTLRACIDAAICFAGADSMFQAETQKLKFWPGLMLSSSAILFAAAFFHEFTQIKIAALLISIPAFVVLSWLYALDDTERAFLIAAPGTLFGLNKTKVA